MSKSNSKLQPRKTSRSTKSASGSTEVTKTVGKCKLSRLSDKISIKPTVYEDVKWFWVAYKKGAFDTFLKPDLSPDEFKQTFMEVAEIIYGFYSVIKDDKPIGLISVTAKNFNFQDYLEPHFDWFYDATDRDKVEAAVKMVLDLRKQHPLFIIIDEKGKKFVTHIAKYGILRRVGKLDQGESQVFLFESMRVKNG